MDFAHQHGWLGAMPWMQWMQQTDKIMSDNYFNKNMKVLEIKYINSFLIEDE